MQPLSTMTLAYYVIITQQTLSINQSLYVYYKLIFSIYQHNRKSK